MRTLMPILLILVSWSGAIPTMAQLSPEILADAYLLRAEQAIRAGDKDRARTEIDKILLLQKEYGLDLAEEFHFRLAKAAGTVGLLKLALESVTKYLQAAGREGSHYVEALELMNQMQDALAGGKETPEPAGSLSLRDVRLDVGGIPEGSKDQEGVPIADRGKTEPPPEPDCSLWNTAEYFKTATADGVRACLEARSDPNVRGKYKMRPLHWAAAYSDNPNVIQVLINAGADWKKRADGIGFEKQSFWESWGDGDLFRNWFRRMRPLAHAAAYNRNPAIAQAFIDAGHKPKSRHLIFAAALNENPAVAQLLIHAGADVNSGKGYWDYKPLAVAAFLNENPAVAQLLIDAGADVNKKHAWGIRAIHLAARHNTNPAVTQTLIHAGADVLARSGGDTPLDFAREAKNSAVIPILRDATARAEGRTPTKKKQDGRGWTAVVAGVTGGAIASASGLDAATATEIGGTIAGSVLTGKPAGNTGSAPGGIPTGNVDTVSGGGQCEIPGYPRPADVQNLGLPWCPATVDFQARVFALQAAGAQCAIATGSSSTPEQIQARRQEIEAACGRLAALGAPNCQCP